MFSPSKSLIPKVPPLCPVFGECGGCLYQDIPYPEELKIKEDLLRDLFDRELKVEQTLFEPIVASPAPYYYRNRLDLKLVKRKDGQVQIGFSPEGRSRLIEIDHCPIARQQISNFLPQLKEEAIARLTPKYKVANLVVRCGEERKVFWGGMGRRSLVQNEKDYLWTTVSGRKIFYALDTFFQANLDILPLAIKRIKSFPFWTQSTVLFDLYGGVGLFTLALIDQVQKVYLIEESQASIKLAWFNKGYHGLNNWEVIEGRVEEYLPNLLGLSEQHPTVAFIDPPLAPDQKDPVTDLL